MKLQGKITTGAIVIVVTVMLFSISLASLLVYHHHRRMSDDIILKSFHIVASKLRSAEKELSRDALQMASLNDMGANLRYVGEGKRQVEHLILKSAYLTIVSGLLQTARATGIAKAAIYDRDGDLTAAISLGEDGAATVEYLHHTPSTSRETASLGPAQRPEQAEWISRSDADGAVLSRSGGIPESPVVRIEAAGRTLFMTVELPVMAQTYQRETRSMATLPTGTLVASIPIPPLFRELGELTATRINVFTAQGLGWGDLPEYAALDPSFFATPTDRVFPGETDILQGVITVGRETFFQGIAPLGDGRKRVGAVASLYSDRSAWDNTWRTVYILSGVSLGAILLVIPVAFLFARSLARRIETATGGLAGASGRVDAAAGRLATSSHSLAVNIQRQAQDMREAVQVLERMAGLIQRNAGDAGQAARVRAEAAGSMDSAGVVMRSVAESMKDMHGHGQAVSDIIRTIDDVAFQTNLLALNAAVEAARAGEAGAGFAVVAAEVRDLASRSAAAARETQEIIGRSVASIQRGVEQVEKMEAAFQALLTANARVGELIQRIAAGLEEEAGGIERVMDSVARVETLSGENSSGAEKVNDISADMAGQAGHMKRMVAELDHLVK